MYIYSIALGTKNKFSICNYNVILVKIVVNQDIKLISFLDQNLFFVHINNTTKI